MKGLWLFVFIILLVGCAKPIVEPDLGKIQKEEQVQDLEMNQDLNAFVKGFSYELGEKLSESDFYDYEVNIVLQAETSFDDLEKREKLALLGHFFNGYIKEDYINCGGPDCKVGTLKLITDNNEYELIDEGAEFSSLLTNGENKYSWKELKEENSKLADEEEARKLANDPKINGVSYSFIYEYMKVAYNDLTENGENYIPEVHDPLVAELASEKFGITKEQAIQIYMDKEKE